MSNLKEKAMQELQEIKDTIDREWDELKVQANLAKADAEDELKKLEPMWDDFKNRLEQLKEDSMEWTEEAMDHSKAMGDEIKEQFAKFKGMFK